MSIITRPRRAKTRHTARSKGLAGIPAAAFITPPAPAETDWRYDTTPLWLPGLRPALATA
jgi:hypothetical protein